jgi:hypothetical protein
MESIRDNEEDSQEEVIESSTSVEVVMIVASRKHLRIFLEKLGNDLKKTSI